MEDGVPQVVDMFQEAVLPVTIVLVLDASGSMTRSAERAQGAAREFVGALRPEDELSLIVFADRVDLMHGPTLRRAWSLEARLRMRSPGRTKTATYSLRPSGRRRTWKWTQARSLSNRTTAS